MEIGRVRRALTPPSDRAMLAVLFVIPCAVSVVMSRGHARDRGSCLHRPDREEENLYKKLPQSKRRRSARDAWLMGGSVATAIPDRAEANVRVGLRGWGGCLVVLARGLPRYRGHYLGGPFFSPILVGFKMDDSQNFSLGLSCLSDSQAVLDPGDSLPLGNRSSQVSGPASVKLVTDGCAGVGDQAPVADMNTGSGENRSRGTSSVKKRPVCQTSDEDSLPAPKLPTSRRGRPASRGASTSQPRRGKHGRVVRSNTTAASEAESDMGVTTEDPGDGGESGASLGSTKAELSAAKREQRKAVAADEVSEMARRARERRAALAAEGGEPSALALSQLALDGVDLVLKVATKSGSLKGTFIRGLKEAAADIRDAVDILLHRTASDEVAKLQEENSRLRNDLEDLRRQVASLSEQQQRCTSTDAAPVIAPTAALRPISPRTDEEVERIIRVCMLQCGNMVDAKLEANRRRLPAEILRPPLAADTRRTEQSPRLPPRKGKPTEDNKKPSEGAPPSDHPTTAGSKGETWVKVVGRKKARKATKKAAVNTSTSGGTAKVIAQPVRRTAKGGRKGPTIHAPRSEAVTLTLQPGAAERGVTYQSVIAEAKAKIKLSDLGLQSVTLRQAATGARLFEVAGAASGSAEKADALAGKMREVLNLEDVRVSRPIKTAEVRIAGLDDSVTSEEVVAAVARSGECLPDKVRTGDIRTDATGLGVVWVRCPVASAKKIADSGRLLVGWVAARVKLLQPRALRCFRCLEKGHVRAKCTAEIDRSDLCYRCGQSGHKAAQCFAALNCSLCSAAGKPAGHKLGEGACGAPVGKAIKKKKRRSKPAGETSPPPQASSSAADSRPRTVAEGMECQ